MRKTLFAALALMTVLSFTGLAYGMGAAAQNNNMSDRHSARRHHRRHHRRWSRHDRRAGRNKNANDR